MRLPLTALAGLFILCLETSGNLDTPFGQWSSVDIGDPGAAGEARYSEGKFVLNGAGEDHWTGTSDSLHYAYGSWSGDGAFIARVTEFMHGDSGPKAGIMFRAGLEANAPHAFALFRPGGATGFEYRAAPGGVGRGTNGISTSLPYWIKLVRSEDTFFGYDSRDGEQWRLIGWTVVEMPETILVGLAVNSHEPGRLITARFDNLQISSRVPKPPSHLQTEGYMERATLSWRDNSTNEHGFLVEWAYGGTNWFGYRQTVGANVTNFTVGQEGYLFPDTIYFRVQAIAEHNSAYSEIAHATTGITGPLPREWQSSDVGEVLVEGSGNFNEGIFRVHGAGSDIGGLVDEFHYVYQELSGNGEMVAFFLDAVPFIGPNWHNSLKAGLMVRGSLAADAANAFIYLTPEYGAGFQARASRGAETMFVPKPEWPHPGMWLRLTRRNEVVNAFMAGITLEWIEVASVRVEMSDPVLFGMAVTSHMPELGQSSAFRNVRLTPERGSVKIQRQSTEDYEVIAEGMIGRTYGIESSLNLRDWNRVLTQTNRTGSITLGIEDEAEEVRFYRSLLDD